MPRHFCQLSGAELDYWVARAEGIGGDLDIRPFFGCSYYDGAGLRCYSPTSQWETAGAIMARELISTVYENIYTDQPWHAFIRAGMGRSTARIYDAYGQTSLEAAMRAYIFKKLGPVVDHAAGEAETPLVLPGATPQSTALAAVPDIPDDRQDAWL